jgi:hypothetical protein
MRGASKRMAEKKTPRKTTHLGKDRHGTEPAGAWSRRIRPFPAGVARL